MPARSDDIDLDKLLRSAQRSTWRIEQQPVYRPAVDTFGLDRFLAGDPLPPLDVPGFQEYLDFVGELTRQGVVMTRVRVEESPPTDYQRLARWLGKWNEAAGETMRYIRRHIAPLSPEVGSSDWWIVDEATLIELRFDQAGNLTEFEVEEDPERGARLLRCWSDLVTSSTHLASSQETKHDATRASRVVEPTRRAG